MSGFVPAVSVCIQDQYLESYMPAFTKPMLLRRGSANDYKAALGQYIKELRQKAGLTQADFAKLLGITYYTSISAIEVGRNVVPPERYADFAKHLGVAPREFAQRVLELTNPWMYVMMFSENPEEDIRLLNEDLGTTYGKEPQDPRLRRQRPKPD